MEQGTHRPDPRRSRALLISGSPEEALLDTELAGIRAVLLNRRHGILHAAPRAVVSACDPWFPAVAEAASQTEDLLLIWSLALNRADLPRLLQALRGSRAQHTVVICEDVRLLSREDLRGMWLAFHRELPDRNITFLIERHGPNRYDFISVLVDLLRSRRESGVTVRMLASAFARSDRGVAVGLGSEDVLLALPWGPQERAPAAAASTRAAAPSLPLLGLPRLPSLPWSQWSQWSQWSRKAAGAARGVGYLCAFVLLLATVVVLVALLGLGVARLLGALPADQPWWWAGPLWLVLAAIGLLAAQRKGRTAGRPGPASSTSRPRGPARDFWDGALSVWSFPSTFAASATKATRTTKPADPPSRERAWRNVEASLSGVATRLGDPPRLSTEGPGHGTGGASSNGTRDER